MTKLCINCRKRTEGPPRIGVTPSGGMFVSKTCDICQMRVDAEIERLRWSGQRGARM